MQICAWIRHLVLETMGLSEEVLQGFNVGPVRDDFCNDTETLMDKAEGMGMRMNHAGIFVPIGLVSAEALCLKWIAN
jgi:hypothetical protein